MSILKRLTNVAKGTFLTATRDDADQKARQEALEQEMAREKSTRRPLSDDEIEQLRARDRQRARAQAEEAFPEEQDQTRPRRPVELDEEGNIKKTL